jgi:hypothetical protein
MRWRCAAGIFQRSAVLSRRTSALLHLAISVSPNQMAQANHTSGKKNNKQFPLLTLRKTLDSRRYGGANTTFGQRQNRPTVRPLGSNRGTYLEHRTFCSEAFRIMRDDPEERCDMIIDSATLDPARAYKLLLEV